MGYFQRYEGKAPNLPTNGTAWIAPTATIVGEVNIARDVSVWYGATVRGDNEPVTLGAGSNVQENAVLHVDPDCPLTVGRNVTIGHGAILHGCAIDDGTTIGMGAIILNRAKIGKNCMIAAGALILENAEIPDGSLVVGTPGKVKRTLTPEGQQQMLRGAETYRMKAPKLLQEMSLDGMT